MPKANELTYVQKIGEHGITHAVNKPFTEPECGNFLMTIGTLRVLFPPPPRRLLDLGCGTGWTSCMFARMGYDVVGQDIAPDMIQLANHNKALQNISNLRFIVSDYEDMRFDNEFECALFFDSLHHAEDEYRALEMAYKALRPGGVLLTREPGDGHSTNAHTMEAVKLYGCTEKDMPPRKICAMAKEIGFSSARVFPSPEIVMHRMLRFDENRLPHPSPWKFYRNIGRLMHSTIAQACALFRANQNKHSAGGIVFLIK